MGCWQVRKIRSRFETSFASLDLDLVEGWSWSAMGAYEELIRAAAVNLEDNLAHRIQPPVIVERR